LCLEVIHTAQNGGPGYLERILQTLVARLAADLRALNRHDRQILPITEPAMTGSTAAALVNPVSRRQTPDWE